MTTAPEIYGRFLEIEDERHAIEMAIVDRLPWIETLTDERDKARSELKRIEANIVINGGAGKVVIDGKNTTLRDAQFTLACQGDAAWEAADKKLRTAQVNLDTCEREIAVRQGILKGKDLSMQMRISQMNFLSTPRFYKEA